MNDNENASIPQPEVIEFLFSYLKDHNIEKALDPAACYGLLLAMIVENGIAQNGIGMWHNISEFETTTKVKMGEKIEWRAGDPLLLLKDYSKQFDLIISIPPIGRPPQIKKFIGEDGLIIRFEETYLLVLMSCLLLKDGGEGIFILPNSFFIKNEINNLHTILNKFGLYVNALIALPKGSIWIKARTSIYFNIVFISRKKTDMLFVAQLEPSTKSSQLIENMRERRSGRVIELGRLVDPKEFTTWHAFVLKEEIKQEAARAGLSPIRLSEIAEEINLGNRSEDGGFESKPNSLYLPLIGNSPAVSNLKELQIKPQNCAQIVLRSGSSSADYIAHFLNTLLGRKVREQSLSGTYIPKINKQTLSNAILFVPSVDTQTEIVDIHSHIRGLILSLEDYEKSLWSTPSEAPKIREKIKYLNQGKGLEVWIETLPFPLASILWRYNADIEPGAKYNHLLNFFEGMAQFIVNIMLSAFHSDKKFFDKHKSEWIDGKVEHSQTFRRTSFGDWIITGERLAKYTRRMLSTPEERDICLNLYMVKTAELLEVLTSKDIYAFLKTVNKYRNDWKGHSGIAGNKEDARRLMALETELTRTRGIISDSFVGTILLSPGKGDFMEGIYDFTVNSLMGAHMIFRKEQIKSVIPMDKTKLYLLDKNTLTPLEMLPFFRIRPSPKTDENACYFYNRVDKDAVRWISYHFEQEAEFVNSDPEVLKILEELGG